MNILKYILIIIQVTITRNYIDKHILFLIINIVL